jgi:hypothetical protein
VSTAVLVREQLCAAVERYVTTGAIGTRESARLAVDLSDRRESLRTQVVRWTLDAYFAK